jgi:hypothetical protein
MASIWRSPPESVEAICGRRSFRRGKIPKDFVHACALVALALAPLVEAAEQQVVFHRHLAEQLAPLGHQRHAARHHGLHAGARDALAVQRQLAVGRQQAHRRAQQRGLAGAVGADDRDDLALFHMQAHAVHRLDGAVGDAEVFQLKDRVAHRASSSSSSSAPPR